MDYLAHHRSRVFTSPISITGVSVGTLTAKNSAVQSTMGKAQPEHSAISFYLKNHCMALLSKRFHKYEPLPFAALELVEDYHATMQQEAIRMFHYLLLICTRESRHCHNLEDLMTEGMTPSFDFNLKIRGTSSSGAVNTFLSDPPLTCLGDYTDHLVDVFYHGKYSGGYGGKAWAVVARVLRDFVHGQYSAETMIDVAFTLAHNNGPIFNKGMLYTHYDSFTLIRILDVQRAGMVPQLVHSHAVKYVSQDHTDYHTKAVAVLGAEICGGVDWSKVVTLGAVGNYKAHPMAVPLKPVKTKTQLEEVGPGNNSFEVMPGVYVKKLMRAEL